MNFLFMETDVVCMVGFLSSAALELQSPCANNGVERMHFIHTKTGILARVIIGTGWVAMTLVTTVQVRVH